MQIDQPSRGLSSAAQASAGIDLDLQQSVLRNQKLQILLEEEDTGGTLGGIKSHHEDDLRGGVCVCVCVCVGNDTERRHMCTHTHTHPCSFT